MQSMSRRKDIDATRLEECKSCDNSGVQKGTQPRQCGTCGGTGQVVQTMRTPMGAFQQVLPPDFDLQLIFEGLNAAVCCALSFCTVRQGQSLMLW